MPAPDSRRLRSLSAPLAAALLAACSADLPTTPLRPPASPHRVVVSAYHVTSTADDGSDGTLRKELSDAADGDTVTIDAALDGQTIVLNGTAIPIVKNVVILGPGSSGITIDANNSSRIFFVAGGSLKVVDATLTRGRETNGGAIFSYVPVVLERVRVVNNQSPTYGGGIYTDATATFTMIDGRISGNVAGVSGGGANFNGPVHITNSTIEGNATPPGASNGGGFSLHADGVLERVTIAGNASGGNGGGAEIVGANGSTTVTLRNSTISGNTSSGNGGGLFVYGAVTLLQYSTVAYNEATAAGGGGLATSNAAPITFDASILAKNVSAAAAEMNCFVLSAPVTFGKSIVDDLSCGSAGLGLIIDDPKLGPLADNGGATRTHALLIGSPAIDLEPSCVVTIDQRGVARPQGPQCDAGAVEFDSYVTPTLSIDPSGTVSQSTGVAVVSGRQGCPTSAALTLRVTVSQQQKVRRVPTTVTGSTDINVTCDATQGWAASVRPLTGSFNNSPATVKVQVVNAPAWVIPASLTASSVVMAWSRR